MSRLILSGVVVANVSLKTLKVSVQSVSRHEFYHKVIKVFKSYLVHDELQKKKVGDSINFVLCKPFSLRKKWKVLY